MDTLVGFKNLGKRLKHLLDSTGYKQKEVKVELGLAKNSISNYIHGTMPEVENLYKLSKFFKVTMEWLFTGEEKTKYLRNGESQLIHTYRKLNERQQEKVDCYLVGITNMFDGLDNRLELLIKNTGYTQKEVTEGANLFEDAISKYVNGRMPDPKSLYQLSKFFQVSMEWLLKGEVCIKGCSEEENQFIRNYRMLTLEGRGEIVGYMNGILDAES